MITRTLTEIFSARFFSGKTILLFEPRQVGKTTLMKQIFQNYQRKSVWLNADN